MLYLIRKRFNTLIDNYIEMRILLFSVFFIFSTFLFSQKEYNLQGHIGSFPIFMSISDYSKDNPEDENNLMGRYFYQSSLKDIVLRGFVKGDTFTLRVEDDVSETAETFLLIQKGDEFVGEWKNKKGKVLKVSLEPINISSLNNKYDNLGIVQKLKIENKYDYARSAFIILNRDTVTTKNEKSFIWFSEKHCDASFFRLGNGFSKKQLLVLNPILDEIHFENILSQLSCASDWSYSKGDGIEYSVGIDYLDSNLIGFEVFSSWYCGGAHPDFGGIGYLLDLNSGKSYDLNDVYDLSPEIIYNLIDRKEHFQKPTNEDDYCDYTDMEVWQYSRWIITKEGVKFTPYFYRAARACEEPFLISFEDLKPYKKATFPYELK